MSQLSLRCTWLQQQLQQQQAIRLDKRYHRMIKNVNLYRKRKFCQMSASIRDADTLEEVVSCWLRGFSGLHGGLPRLILDYAADCAADAIDPPSPTKQPTTLAFLTHLKAWLLTLIAPGHVVDAAGKAEIQDLFNAQPHPVWRRRKLSRKRTHPNLLYFSRHRGIWWCLCARRCLIPHRGRARWVRRWVLQKDGSTVVPSFLVL
jgi:hypothetical protein